MKIFNFIISLLIVIGLSYALSIKLGPAPPLGNFLSPSIGFWQNAEDRNLQLSSNLIIEGLVDDVSVIYDKNHFPHIFANNNQDLYFAQGYVTAKDRLWQMEFQTYAAAGRLSEILGVNEGVQDYDRTARRKGMVFAAKNTIDAINDNEEILETVNAYTNGINAYISSLSQGELPFEYKLLGYKPEAWTNLKVALLLKYMANDLSFGERDLQNTNALALLGRENFDLIYPDMDTPLDPIVNKPNGWDFSPIIKDSIETDQVVELITNKLVPEPDPLNGSNNWAVSGSKTNSGNPILCSDPHLGLNLPSLWYTIQLSSPDVNVMGASLPGSPNVIIGFNDSIAWGVTNAQRDLVDWYKITFKDDTHNEYKLDGKWVKTDKVIEEIKIAGGETVYDTVLYTHFGPVTFDDTFHPSSEKKYYALRWIAHDASLEALAFYKLNRAKNHSDYMAALDYYSAPAQNFAFASVHGDIAMRVQGKYPNKSFEEGKFLLDGSTTEHDWTFIPFEQNVMDKNPERGFVSSANQYPADTTYPYYITARSYESYRNRRINNQLREMDSITVKELMSLQTDNYNLKAAESLPYFLSVVDTLSLSSDEKNAVAILKSWDLYNNVNSLGASYYEAWWDALYPLTWASIRDLEVDLPSPTAYNTIKLLMENPDFNQFDNPITAEKENANNLITQSFKEMAIKMKSMDALEGWSDYKQTYIKHLLRLEPFGRYNIPIGGNHQIVNATSENHGPSWRMVVDMDPNGVKAYGVYPGGQSGNPGSKQYEDMIDVWASGNYFELDLMRKPESSPANTLIQQTLSPKTK